MSKGRPRLCHTLNEIRALEGTLSHHGPPRVRTIPPPSPVHDGRRGTEGFYEGSSAGFRMRIRPSESNPSCFCRAKYLFGFFCPPPFGCLPAVYENQIIRSLQSVRQSVGYSTFVAQVWSRSRRFCAGMIYFPAIAVLQLYRGANSDYTATPESQQVPSSVIDPILKAPRKKLEF